MAENRAARSCAFFVALREATLNSLVISNAAGIAIRSGKVYSEPQPSGATDLRHEGVGKDVQGVLGIVCRAGRDAVGRND